MGVILLKCGLPWDDSFLIGELRTGVGRVTIVLTSSRLAGGIPVLAIGLDNVLCMSEFPAVPFWALELEFPGLLAAVLWILGVTMFLAAASRNLGVTKSLAAASLDLGVTFSAAALLTLGVTLLSIVSSRSRIAMLSPLSEDNNPNI